MSNCDCDDIYFIATPGSEAYRRIDAYWKSLESNRETLNKLMREMGIPKNATVYHSGGSVHAFSRKGTKVEQWVNPRGCAGWFPKRVKANMAMIKRLSEIDMGSTGSIAKAVFGKATLHFGEGLSVMTGCGAESVSGRYVLSFADDDHWKDYAKSAPRGLRRVKASTVVKWRESEKQAA